MESKKERVLNVRVTERQRVAYERAAGLEGTTLTGFVTAAADQRAEAVLAAHSSLRVTSEVFDGLLAMLDAPGERLAWMEKVLSSPRFQNR
ncbi:MAG: type II toxin-antitoxin system TacA family antitoxin [Acidimicrobiales bacterium]